MPAAQVAMLCFMMWMSGSTLHIFSIMMTINGIYQPLSGEGGALVCNRRISLRMDAAACRFSEPPASLCVWRQGVQP